MAKIAVIDADLIGRRRHNFPNLTCMKISGYHKNLGDDVTLKLDYDDLDAYDKVYIAKVFTDTYFPDGGLFGKKFLEIVKVMPDGGLFGKKFLEIVKVMPDDVILIAKNEKENCLEISSGRSNYSVATMNADDFPKVTQDDTETRFEINAPALKSAIKRTVFACSNDEMHPLYTGCLFDIADEKITIAATNMHRLAVVKDVFLNAPTAAKFIVPATALNVIAGMLPDEDGTVSVYYSGKSISFIIEGIFIKARLIEGNFPDYNRVIPAESKITVDFVTDELRHAVERISVISSAAQDKKIYFKIASGGVEISAYSAEFGEGKEFLSADVDGGELDICFNSRYITDVLKDFKSDNFQMALKGEFDPALVRDADNYIYVVTPVRA